jgi:hypothetical protein
MNMFVPYPVLLVGSRMRKGVQQLQVFMHQHILTPFRKNRSRT